MSAYLASGSVRAVSVVEVGPRDGLQSEARFVPTAQKIALIEQMLAAGLRHIEVSSFVSPKAVPQLADAEEVLAGIERPPEGCTLSALVANARGAERAARSAVDVGILLCSASETHNQKNLNRSIGDSLAGMAEVARTVQAAGKRVAGVIATAFGCPFEGEVAIDALLKISTAYATLGVRQLTLGDTTGMASPPLIERSVTALRAALPELEIGLHLHNTRGIGLANVLTGLDLGVRRFDASVGGLGGCPFAAGATGNICTEDLLFLLHECGWQTGVDLDAAIAVAHAMEACVGRPLVGQVMRAGPRLRLHALDAARTAEG